jgi:hypothetical protein
MFIAYPPYFEIKKPLTRQMPCSGRKISALPPEFDRTVRSHLAGTNMPIPDNGGKPLKPHDFHSVQSSKTASRGIPWNFHQPFHLCKRMRRVTPFSHSCYGYYTMHDGICQQKQFKFRKKY